jgi:hypothetical protein
MNKLKALHFEHPEDKELNKYLSAYKLVYKQKPNTDHKIYKANFVGFLCDLDNKMVTAEPFIGDDFTQIRQRVLEYLFNT